jgi:hypothetical protein
MSWNSSYSSCVVKSVRPLENTTLENEAVGTHKVFTPMLGKAQGWDAHHDERHSVPLPTAFRSSPFGFKDKLKGVVKDS